MQSGTGGSPRGFGVLFDIDGLGGGLYGHAAYKVLFNGLDLALLRGCTFRDGDTRATLSGQSNQYCIGIEAPSSARLAELRQAVISLKAPGLLPGAARFLSDAAMRAEPLVQAARISSAGELQGDRTGWITAAWKEARQGSGESQPPTAPTAEATHPAGPSQPGDRPANVTPAQSELRARFEPLNTQLNAIPSPTKPRDSNDHMAMILAGGVVGIFMTSADDPDTANVARMERMAIDTTASNIRQWGVSHPSSQIFLKMLTLGIRAMHGQPLPSDTELDAAVAETIETLPEIERAITPASASTATASKKCFIATAAYGADQADDVVRLRQLRDDVLVRSSAGRLLLDLYETISPPLAARIATSPGACRWTRRLVVQPARRLADIVLEPEPPTD